MVGGQPGESAQNCCLVEPQILPFCHKFIKHNPVIYVTVSEWDTPFLESEIIAEVNKSLKAEFLLYLLLFSRRKDVILFITPDWKTCGRHDAFFFHFLSGTVCNRLRLPHIRCMGNFKNSHSFHHVWFLCGHKCAVRLWSDIGNWFTLAVVFQGEPLPAALVELVRNSPISSIEDLQLLLLTDSVGKDLQALIL